MAEVEYGPADEGRLIVFGDGTMAYLIRAYEDKFPKGLTMMRFVFRPYRDMKEKWHLSDNDYNIDMREEIMEKQYPSAWVREMSGFPTSYIVLCDLWGNETELTKMGEEDKMRIEHLEKENHRLIGQVASLQEELKDATSDIVKYISDHVELFQELQKTIKVVPIKTSGTTTAGPPIIAEEGEYV